MFFYKVGCFARYACVLFEGRKKFFFQKSLVACVREHIVPLICHTPKHWWRKNVVVLLSTFAPDFGKTFINGSADIMVTGTGSAASPYTIIYTGEASGITRLILCITFFWGNRLALFERITTAITTAFTIPLTTNTQFTTTASISASAVVNTLINTVTMRFAATTQTYALAPNASIGSLSFATVSYLRHSVLPLILQCPS